VRETFAELERQCLGLTTWCLHGSFVDSHADGSLSLITIQYEVTGPGGGTWHLQIESDDCDEGHGVDVDDCELGEGPFSEPDVIVRASADDWVALWTGQESAQSLLDSGRLSVVTDCYLLQMADEQRAAEFPRCLSFLGILGPLQVLEHAMPRDTPRSPEPPDEVSPTIARFRLFPLDWAVERSTEGQTLGEGDPRGEARPLVEAAVRLMSKRDRLLEWLPWLTWGVIASVLAGSGFALVYGWRSVLRTWGVFMTVPLVVGLRYFGLHVRLRRFEARLLPWARRSPRVLRLLVEAKLLDHGPSEK
jgi:hypothetical protein